MKRFCIKVGTLLLFLALAAVVLEGVITRNLRSSTANLFKSYNDMYSGSLHCNVLINGHSRGLVQYDTQILDSILGCDSYNLSVNGRAIDAEIAKYHAYKRNCGTPKLLIQNVDFATMHASKNYEREQYFPYLTMDDSLYAEVRETEDFSWADRYIPLLRYSGYVQVVKEGLHIRNKMPHGGLHKGYAPSDASWDGSMLANIKCVGFDTNAESTANFLRFLQECKADGVEVVFVLAPIYIGVTDRMEDPQAMFDWYQSIADRFDYKVLNYTYDHLSYDTAFFYNATHLNREGATRFSTHLAEDLKTLHNRGELAMEWLPRME
ncbi:MAG: hypothetical protein IJU19_08310 [Bacteroidales bacterium]|nr:hypothetical protein [Bacteroidales bacterium]